MEKEFNLSDYVEQSGATYPDSFKLKVGKVKEAVRRLKDKMGLNMTIKERRIYFPIIDEIFGEKLI